jgi:hypothetical protein
MPSYDGPRIKVCTASVFEGSNPWTCLMRSIGDRGLKRQAALVSSVGYGLSPYIHVAR